MTWEEPPPEDLKVMIQRIEALLDRVTLYLDFESIIMCETGRQKYEELLGTVADLEKRLKTLEGVAGPDVL